MTREVWKPIPGHDEEASSLGRVRRAGRVLKLSRSGSGYLTVTVRRGDGWATANVHRLVAAAFHGEPDGLTVNHRDGDKLNCAPDNLEWVTRSENQTHAYRIGLRRRKLTDAARFDIALDWQRGASQRSLARRHGVTLRAIQKVLAAA